MTESEGHEEIAGSVRPAHADHMRVLNIFDGARPSSSPTQLFDEVGGLYPFFQRISRIGTDEAVRMRVEFRRRSGLGRDNREAKSIAGDEMGCPCRRG